MRLPFREQTVKALFTLAGNQCAFPGCKEEIADASTGKIICQICHIEAAEPRGPRYNANQTDEDRRAIDNLVILCYKHHVMTDDTLVYTVEKLKEIKTSHEMHQRGRPMNLTKEFLDRAAADLIDQFEKLYVIALETRDTTKSVEKKIDAIMIAFDINPEVQQIKLEKARNVPPEAIKRIAELERELGGHINSSLNLASIYLYARQYAAAEQLYEKVLKSDPRSAMVWNGRGVMNDFKGHLDESIACFDKALEISPDEPIIWSNRSYSMLRLENFAEALRSAEKALESRPDFSYALNHKGMALRHLNRNQEALTCHEQAIKLDSTFAGAWINKGLVLHALGRYSEALQVFETAEDLDPDNLELIYQKAKTFKALRKDSEADLALQKLLKRQPIDFKEWLQRGNLLRELGRNEEAIVAFKKALELDEYYAGYADMGLAYIALGKHDEAMKCFDKAIEMNPRSSWVMANKGQLHYERNEVSKAMECFDKVLSIDPYSQRALLYYITYYMALRMFNSALEFIDRFLKNSPNAGVMWHFKGLAMRGIGEVDNAMDCFKRAEDLGYVEG